MPPIKRRKENGRIYQQAIVPSRSSGGRGGGWLGRMRPPAFRASGRGGSGIGPSRGLGQGSRRRYHRFGRGRSGCCLVGAQRRAVRHSARRARGSRRLGHRERGADRSRGDLDPQGARLRRHERPVQGVPESLRHRRRSRRAARHLRVPGARDDRLADGHRGEVGAGNHRRQLPHHPKRRRVDRYRRGFKVRLELARQRVPSELHRRLGRPSAALVPHGDVGRPRGRGVRGIPQGLHELVRDGLSPRRRGVHAPHPARREGYGRRDPAQHHGHARVQGRDRAGRRRVRRAGKRRHLRQGEQGGRHRGG